MTFKQDSPAANVAQSQKPINAASFEFASLFMKHPQLFEQQRSYVGALIDITVQVMTSIWPSAATTTTNDSSVADLHTFLGHILKHARTTHSTLQLAIFYLFRIRGNVQKRRDNVYVSCGRRMFLAALISAHKYLQDKTYKNSAWSKVSGLHVSEINHAEKTLLELLDYRLYVKKETYEQWIAMLQYYLKIKPPRCVPSVSISASKKKRPILSAEQSLPSPPQEESILYQKRKNTYDDNSSRINKRINY